MFDPSHVEIGDQTYLEEGGDPFGAVRGVRGEALVVWIQNAGDFEVPFGAVRSAHDHKVVLDPDRIDDALRDAIAHAEDALLSPREEIE
ncbi:MAG: hypothetical protein DCC71_18285 [Proteobacteria bacterium]|nr:MAG: hypothetical protein DCC71_18285 [Pseudomonadota bacterium]